MQSEIRYSPAFSAIFVELSGNDRIAAESDAMVSRSSNVGMDTRVAGGFFSAVGRSFFGGESFFINQFYLDSGQTGEVVLTQPTPGEVVCHELNGGGICLQPGAFIASTGDIKMSTKWAGIRSWIAREGMFKLYLAGKGKVWFGAYGGVVEKQVQGEYLVDTSHLVAYEPQFKIKLQMAGGGLISSFFSGEGLVTRLEGTGKIYLQTRSLQGLGAWINPRLY